MRTDFIIIGILFILHLVGAAALWFDVHPDFILLTPINLVVTFGLVLSRHRGMLQNLGFVLGLSFVIGFLAELVGVNTGLLFGEYSYGPVLGLKVYHTPLMIGFNWAMLVYCSGMLANAVVPSRIWPLRAILGASLMTALDFLIEPVAVRYNFWTWENSTIPLTNYLDWFLVSLLLHVLFQKLLPESKNKAAIALFFLQAMFFLTVCLK